MDIRHLEHLTELFARCQELRDRLNEAREALTDDEFEAAYEGPFAEILCSAMDVEAALERCEDS